MGLVGLTLLLAAGRPFLAKHSRLAAVVFTALVLVAVLPIAGVPLRWIVHVRIAVTARAIGEGLSALPQTLVPYRGVNQWVRRDFVLGGAVLLFDAALLLAFAPRRMSDFPAYAEDDMAGAVATCLRAATSASVELVVLDQSRPDLDLSVMRVLAPGLRHFWRRLAPGRLYDAPVRMGWLDAPTAEDKFNPWNVFF